MMGRYSFMFACLIIVGLSSCKGDLTDIAYSPTTYKLEGTENLGVFPEVADNPLTHEGIKLGQHLFFDPILSSNNKMSCASCHDPQLAFTDGKALSTGVLGKETKRSSMSIVNSAYYTKGLFWDGRTKTLEEQALLPVEEMVELNHNWGEIEKELQNHSTYPRMFREAFGIEDSDEISKFLAAKAIAQFQRIAISGNSRYDRFANNEIAFSDEEELGFRIFFDTDPLVTDGECAHCHNAPLLTTNQYFDNGIQNAAEGYTDRGLGLITGLSTDDGKMRAPTLRNIVLTAPYMHDGRFKTLEEVVEHYNSGGHNNPNQDALVYPLGLDDEQKEALVQFLHTLTDTSYLENPYLQDPFK